MNRKFGKLAILAIFAMNIASVVGLGQPTTAYAAGYKSVIYPNGPKNEQANTGYINSILHSGWTMSDYINASPYWEIRQDASGKKAFTSDPKTNYWPDKDGEYGTPTVYKYGEGSKIIFSENKNKTLTTSIGHHIYNRTLASREDMPVWYWVAVGNPLACHNTTTGATNPFYYRGFPFSKLVAGVVPCEKAGDSTAWNPVCATCGKAIEMNFYASANAVASLPSITCGGYEYVYSCRICGNMEQGVGVGHTCVGLSPNRYNIQYDSNTKDPVCRGLTAPQTVYYKQSSADGSATYEGTAVKGALMASASGYVRPGYVQTGWNTKKDGSGVAIALNGSLEGIYNNADTVTNIESIATYKDAEAGEYNITLYAQWRAVTSTLKIDANTSPAQYQGGATYNGQPSVSLTGTRHAYSTKKDWEKSASDYVINTYTINTGLITAPKGYTVTFNANGGSVSGSNTVMATTHFSGYDTSRVSSGSFANGVYSYGTTENAVDTVVLKYEEDTILLPSASKSGTLFVGWYENGKYVGDTGDAYLPQGNVTLVARYETLNIEVENVYYTKNGGEATLNNIEMSNGKANNEPAGKEPGNSTYAVNNAKGAVSIKASMFTKPSWKTVYRPEYKLSTENDTQWKLLNTVNNGNDNVHQASYNATYSNPSATYQYYTVQSSGIYKVTAYGAQGGNSESYKGGNGGETTGQFYLKKGEVLRMTVGGQDGTNGGGTRSNNSFGCGGGYTLVEKVGTDGTVTTLMLAGGGGGATSNGDGGAGGNTTGLRDDQYDNLAGNAGKNGAAGGGGGLRGGKNGESSIGSNIINTTVFNYTGSVQDFEVPSDSLYKLVVYGAQGGAGNDGHTWMTADGGNGGTSTGYIQLTAGTHLYVCVGGGGGGEDRAGAGTSFNGGGGGSGSDGGGATHIAIGTNRGLLSGYNYYRDEVLIVAGGGGGGVVIDYCGNDRWLNGGSGGGTNGGAGGNSWWDSESERVEGTAASGYGGSQTETGTRGNGGGFGYGGSGEGGGGGGGWYGGCGATNWNGAGSGGGGSGYIGGVPAITIDGTTYSPSTSNGGKTGNGQAIIYEYENISEPSYGGSSWINGDIDINNTAATNPGIREGNGCVVIEGIVVDLLDGDTNIATMNGLPIPDKAAPSSVGELKLSTNASNNTVVSWNTAVSNGTEYNFRVKMFNMTSDYNKDVPTQTSSVVTKKMESALAGYYVLLDNNASTNVASYVAGKYSGNYTWRKAGEHASGVMSDGKTLRFTSNTQDVFSPGSYTYVHVAAVDVAGNIGPSSHKLMARTNISVVNFDLNKLEYSLANPAKGTWRAGSSQEIKTKVINGLECYYGYYATDGCRIANSGNGVLNNSSTVYKFGGPFPTPAAVAGSRFVGWNSKSDGSGVYYSYNGADDTSSLFVETKELVISSLTGSGASGQEITLYAIWTDDTTNTLSVTYKGTDWQGNGSELAKKGEASYNVASMKKENGDVVWSNHVTVCSKGQSKATGIWRISQIGTEMRSNTKKTSLQYYPSSAPASSVYQYQMLPGESVVMYNQSASTKPDTNFSVNEKSVGVTYDNLQGTFEIVAKSESRTASGNQVGKTAGANRQGSGCETAVAKTVIKVDRTMPAIESYSMKQTTLNDFKMNEIESVLSSGRGMSTSFSAVVSDYNNPNYGACIADADGKARDSSGIAHVRLYVFNAYDYSDNHEYEMAKKGSTLDITKDGAVVKAEYAINVDLYADFPNASKLKYIIYAVDNAGNVSNKNEFENFVKQPDGTVEPGVPTGPVQGSDSEPNSDGTYTPVPGESWATGEINNFSIRVAAWNDEDDEFNDHENEFAFFQTGDIGHVEIWTVGYCEEVSLDFGLLGEESYDAIENNQMLSKYALDRNSVVPGERRTVPCEEGTAYFVNALNVYNEATQSMMCITSGGTRNLTYQGNVWNESDLVNALNTITNEAGKSVPYACHYEADYSNQQWWENGKVGVSIRIPVNHLLTPTGETDKYGTAVYENEEHIFAVIGKKNGAEVVSTNKLILWDMVSNDVHYRVIHEN